VKHLCKTLINIVNKLRFPLIGLPAHYAILLPLFILMNHGQAQNPEPMRIELLSKSVEKSHHIELLGEKGLLIYFESNEVSEKSERKWYFSFQSVELEEKWLQFVLLKDGMVLEKSVRQGDRLLMLFAVKSSKKNDQSEFQLLMFDLSTEKFSLIGGALPPNSTISAFEVIQDQAFVFLSHKNEISLLLANLSTAQVKPLRIPMLGQSSVQASYADQKEKQLVLAIKNNDGNRFEADVFLVFDSNGSEIYRYAMENDNSVYIHSFVIDSDKQGSMRVVGCYDLTDKRKTRQRESAPEFINETYGFFYLAFNQSGLLSKNQYELKILDNFHAALGSYDQIRSQQKKGRSGRKDKRLSIALQLYNPMLIQSNGQLIFAAEAFRPKFRSETRMDYDFYGRPIPYTYNVFDGYEFFTSVIIGFNEEGKLIWNNDFDMRDLISFDLKKHLMVYDDLPDGLVLAYVNQGKVNSKMINKDQTLGQTEQTRLEPKFESDRIQQEDNSRIEHWYEHYFLAYGYQKIMNNRLRDGATRNVLFLNKIKLE